MLDRITRNKAPFIVGSIYFLVIMVLIYFYMFAVDKGMRPQGMRIPVLLNTAEGLRSGSLVTVQGVIKGRISSLHFLNTDQNNRPLQIKKRVMAILDLDEKIEFYTNSRIRTLYSNLVGRKVLNIDVNPEEKHNSVENYLVLSLDEISEFHLSGTLPERNLRILSGSNFDEPVYLVTKVLQENRIHLASIFKDVHEISYKLNQGDRFFAVLLNNPFLYEQTVAVIYQLNLLLNQGGELNESLRESNSISEMGGWLFSFASLALGI